MPYNLQQNALVNRVTETLVTERAHLRNNAANYADDINSKYVPEWVVAEMQSLASNTRAKLNAINNNSQEIRAAVVAKDMEEQDFIDRYSELDSAVSAVEGATVDNIEARLNAIVSNLPPETLL